MIINTKEQIIELTKQWKGERLEDGRPKVPDHDLEKLRHMTLEEIWLPLYVKGYQFQYEGGLRYLHEGKKLVGRAVTCTFMPTRPDLFEVVKEKGDQIEIRVEDNGKGMTAEQISQIYQGGRDNSDSTGIGIHNVISRLGLYYNSEVTLVIESDGPGLGTRVILTIPKKEGKEHVSDSSGG